MVGGRALLLVVILRFVVGGFWFEHSQQKWGWFESGELHSRFLRWNKDAQGVQKLYIEKFCLPFWKTLQYAVVFGQLAVAVSFLLGFWTKVAALGGAFMAVNFIFAQGGLLTWRLIGNPYGPVVVTATIVAAYAGGEALWSIRRLMARSKLAAETAGARSSAL
ncbi:MAG: DoxX family membrane protein [Acidobacteria bacterium]|nr:DoxX family membrane protein [Acidobacteriota bacterium]